MEARRTCPLAGYKYKNTTDAIDEEDPVCKQDSVTDSLKRDPLPSLNGRPRRRGGLNRGLSRVSMLAFPLLSPPGIAPMSVPLLLEIRRIKGGPEKEANPYGTCVRAFGSKPGGYREWYYEMWIIGGWVLFTLFFFFS